MGFFPHLLSTSLLCQGALLSATRPDDTHGGVSA